MDVISTLESAAHSAVEAVEHPFHTIGNRLREIGGHIASFLGHPYAAPPLAQALTMLHGVVTDLAQEVAELRVPCPCKPAPTGATVAAGDAGQASSSTSAAAGDAGQASSSTSAAAGDAAPQATTANADFETVSGADLAEFHAWKNARAAAELISQSGA